MTSTVLGIVAAVLGFAFWLIRRSLEKTDDPVQQNVERKEAADAAIARGPGGVDDVNRQLESLLRLRSQPNPRDPGRQGGAPPSSGPVVHRDP